MVYLVYLDESGDDGPTVNSSSLFVLSSLYMPYISWKENFNRIREFRKELKNSYGFPIRLEFHTNAFLANKNPYYKFGWSEKERLEILKKFVGLFPTLNLKIVNIVVNKIVCKFPILEVALKFNIQRIENDLKNNPENSFLLITDKGRIKPMRKICRKIQVINPTPSRFDTQQKLSLPIRQMLEDPFEKESEESYFLQMADTLSFLIYMFCSRELLKREFRNRIAYYIDHSSVLSMLEVIKPVCNHKVGPRPYCDYGIKIYP